MTTTSVPEQLTHTVQFSRKVSVRQYESAEASIFIQFSTDRDASPQDIVAGAVQAFSEAKGIVYQQLGLPHDLLDGVVVELVEEGFGPGTQTVKKAAPKAKAEPAPAPDVAGGDVSGGVPAKPPFAGTTKDKDEKKANTEWAKARLASNPDEFYDNRADNAKALAMAKTEDEAERIKRRPAYKHKDSTIGVWEDAA